MSFNRRQFLAATTGVGLGAAAPVAALAAEKEKAGQEFPVSAAEDLMREHGVLDRLLLVYETGLRRLRAGEPVPAEVFHGSATIVRRFIEDYHGMLEEKFLFPEFEKQNVLVDLVAVLRRQHQAGRVVTDVILRNASEDRFRSGEARRDVIRACEASLRMFRPHEAQEDTVLFPALRKIMSAQQLEELGEQFEEQEEQLFGEGGFQRTVEQVADLERQLGIHDLAQFTADWPR